MTGEKRHILGLVGALLGVCLTTSCALGQDAVAAWLEDVGLQRLLARRLESRLDIARDSGSRAAVAQQLAETYAALLEAAPTGAERDELEARGRAVLAMINDADGDPLRLALLRSSYSAASRECELRRLALESSSSTEELRTRLTTIADQLGEVRDRLERRERVLERRINRTRGIEAQLMGSRSDDVGHRIAQATFLEAWARAYIAWIRRDREQALESQKLFSRLLATGDAFPDPVDVSLDLRDNEIYAESILGMAFAKSLTDSIATVRTWLGLLDAPETAVYVRSSLPYWRIALLADAGAYGEAILVLRGLRPDAATSWLRLAAVAGLSSTDGGEAARALGTEAIALLAARGDLAQVVDLAERFGLAEMERDGFALHYVSGVCRYEDARASSEAGDLATARSTYRAALEDLDAALAEPDAGEFTDAVPGVVAMRAWCLHELGEFADASVLFEKAAELHSGNDAGNLLWMAITSLDDVERAGGGGASFNDHRAELIDRFLDDHPSHPSAPSALLRRFATISDPTLEDAEILVAVPKNSATGARAHQEGVQMLYRIFRRGDKEDRLQAGRRFLDVVPMPRFDPEQEPTERMLDALRARQLLEIALTPAIAQTRIARDVLDSIDRAVIAGLIDFEGKERELDYRRMRLALMDGDFVEALRFFGLLETGEIDDWTLVAARTLFNGAAVVLLETDLPQLDTRAQHGIDAIRRSTVVLLGEHPEEADFTNPEKYMLGRALALAEQRAYDSNGNVASLARALAVFTALAAVREHDEGILEGLARAAEESGLDEQALSSLRTLVAGSTPGTDDWFRRKVELVRVLSRVDSSRAREVLDQHVVLHPEYGPQPWGDHLRELHAQLGSGGGAS